jgi:GNAT superfamily N-acetyltransferase
MYDQRVLGGPLHLWVGYAAGEPVTVAAAQVDERVVGIYAVATLPHARGKGYGRAITAQATQAAPALPAVLQASADGQSVYLRLGFEIVAPYTLWLHERTAWPPAHAPKAH